ncbi:unnamed protein product [Rotaria socialis]|uniref:Uncharacterized protein n=1 Tax=Rotaria socialis TaxID=392032 RepID=A0A818DZN0_9BILA|nr:unnamed protein product [Rotaria socialis]CAF3455757.1 unnamed protein product [Rotaria socialis]
MFSSIRLQCYRILSSPAVRYASSKKKQVSLSSAPVINHNWFDMASEICPTDTSNLSSVPDSSFNKRIIQYLSDSIKTPLSTHVNQHLLDSFQTWSPNEFYDLITVLGSYGLQPDDVLRLLVNLPSSDKSIVTIENLKQCFENLLKLQFDTTTRSILISNDPDLIQYDLSYLRERLDVLLCYFTKREIYKLVRTHKKLFSENWTDLDYKINYLRIMLFASTRDIVESGALAHTIDHIRQRYLFVYRAGLFKRVRREEQYVSQRDLNIHLIDVFSTSLTTFLKRTTNNLLRQDDYQAFIDSLKYETFDNEFERYLTLDKNRKNWSRADVVIEKRERRRWMSEFDMYNNIDDEDDGDDDDDDETSLTIINEKSLAPKNDEEKPSSWHTLSDFGRDRHRNRKIAQNSDPNIRL